MSSTAKVFKAVCMLCERERERECWRQRESEGKNMCGGVTESEEESVREKSRARGDGLKVRQSCTDRMGVNMGFIHS